MADKDYAATREEWVGRVRSAWSAVCGENGSITGNVADHMIAQGWLPLKEPEREPGIYLIKNAGGTHLAEWANGDWYTWRDRNGRLVGATSFDEPYTCTHLRPDSEVKG